MDATFTATQISRLTGLGYDTVDHWAKTGLCPPSIQDAHGPGSERRYSFRDLVALKAAAELRRAGVSAQALRKVIDHLRARGYEQPLAEVYLVSDGRDVFERHGDELVSVLRRPGQSAFTWILDLGRVVEELRAALAA